MQLIRRITIAAAAAALGAASFGVGAVSAEEVHELTVDGEKHPHSSVDGPTIHWWTNTPAPKNANYGDVHWNGINGAGHIGSCEAQQLEFESMHWVLTGANTLVISGVACSQPDNGDNGDNGDNDNGNGGDNGDNGNGGDNGDNGGDNGDNGGDNGDNGDNGNDNNGNDNNGNDNGDEAESLPAIEAPASGPPPTPEDEFEQLPPPATAPAAPETAPSAPEAPAPEPVTTLPATGTGTAITAIAALLALLGGLGLVALARRPTRTL